MEPEFVNEARKVIKPKRELILSPLYIDSAKNLSGIYRSMINELIAHYLFGKSLRGKVKQSSGVYSGKGIWHYHIDFNKNDPLLKFQLNHRTLNLLAICSHIQCFGQNEQAFFDSISEHLIERKHILA